VAGLKRIGLEPGKSLPVLAAPDRSFELKTERATLSAKGRQIETEAAPIRYVTELIGPDTDPEQGNPVADRAHGLVLRPSCYRIDGCGCGTEVNRKS
jgi:hypothetical protein